MTRMTCPALLVTAVTCLIGWRHHCSRHALTLLVCVGERHPSACRYNCICFSYIVISYRVGIAGMIEENSLLNGSVADSKGMWAVNLCFRILQFITLANTVICMLTMTYAISMHMFVFVLKVLLKQATDHHSMCLSIFSLSLL